MFQFLEDDGTRLGNKLGREDVFRGQERGLVFPTISSSFLGGGIAFGFVLNTVALSNFEVRLAYGSYQLTGILSETDNPREALIVALDQIILLVFDVGVERREFESFPKVAGQLRAMSGSSTSGLAGVRWRARRPSGRSLENTSPQTNGHRDGGPCGFKRRGSIHVSISRGGWWRCKPGQAIRLPDI